MCQIARRLIKEEQSKFLVSESEYDMVLMARMAEKREGKEMIDSPGQLLKLEIQSSFIYCSRHTA